MLSSSGDACAGVINVVSVMCVLAMLCDAVVAGVVISLIGDACVGVSNAVVLWSPQAACV